MNALEKVGLNLMRILALLAALIFLKYIFLNLCQQSRVKKINEW